MYEDFLRRIIEDNRKSRQQFQDRLSRLSSVLQTGNQDEFSAAIESILNESGMGQGERQVDEVLGEDGETEPLVGDNGSTEDTI